MAAETVELSEYAFHASDPKGRIAGLQGHREASNSYLAEANDIVRLFKCHYGRLPTRVKFWTDALDSNAARAIILDVYFTDGTTTVTVIDNTDVAQYGGVVEADLDTYDNWFLKNIFDTHKWRLEVKVVTAPGTAAAGLYGAIVETIGQ